MKLKVVMAVEGCLSVDVDTPKTSAKQKVVEIVV